MIKLKFLGLSFIVVVIMGVFFTGCGNSENEFHNVPSETNE